MEIEKNLAQLILSFSNTIIKNRNRHLAVLNLTAVQADSIKFLINTPDATIKDLKEHLGIAHQTAQGLVARMEDKGLIAVRESYSDKRCRKISVTQKGLELRDQIVANGIRTEGILLSRMTEEESAVFVHLLHMAYENAKKDVSEVEKTNDNHG